MQRNNSITPFQQRVYDAVRKIPEGRVATYGYVASVIGCGSARAIGQALRKNPFAPQVPCHRVIQSDGTIGGFTGQKSGPEIQRKMRLLKNEGVLFDPSGKLKDYSRLLR